MDSYNKHTARGRTFLLTFCALAVTILPTGCGKPHEVGVLEVQSSNCIVCHQADYDGAQNPVHIGNFPTTCVDCHVTAAWQPALEGDHPENNFPIANGPHTFECLECHDTNRGSSVDGANTDCVGCHTGEHTRQRMANQHNDVDDYVFIENMPSFCLECHPDGQE